jgi:hypothetical protein
MKSFLMFDGMAVRISEIITVEPAVDKYYYQNPTTEAFERGCCVRISIRGQELQLERTNNAEETKARFDEIMALIEAAYT